MKLSLTNIKYFLLVFFSFVCFNDLSSQIAIGDWRTHLSYNTISCITGSKEKVYGASNAGIQVYDKGSNSLGTLDGVKGLNDIGISALQYISEINTLVIGYKNGNLDLLKQKQITNYPGIKNTVSSGDKRLHDILYLNDRVLLASDFGITEFNPSLGQFGDNYYIVEGDVIRINDLAKDEQYIYAATEQGIYYADYSDNLFLPSNWSRLETLSYYNQNYKLVESFKGSLIVVMSDFNEDDVLYRIDNFSTSSVLLDNKGNIESIYAGETGLYVATSTEISVFSNSYALTESIESYPFGPVNPLALFVSENGDLWIGDENVGMARKSQGGQFEQILRNGPATDKVFDIQSAPGYIYVSAGGFSASFNNLNNPGMLYFYSEGGWSSYQFDQYGDFTNILINKGNPSDVYIASWSDGIIRFLNNEPEEVFNSDNSPLESTGNDTKVHSLAGDNNGNLAMINHGAQNPLLIKLKNDEWVELPFEELEGTIPEEIHWAENNYIWGSLYNSSNLFVIDLNETLSNTEDDRIKILEPLDSRAKPYTDEIYEIEEDREGNIWISTSEGIGIVYDARFVFEEDIFQPDRPKITEDDFTQFVLRDNIVNDIYSDPANRKWVATKKAGVMVFSPNAERLVSHFTSENSPLLSNNVLSLSMNEENGEVFMGTSEGIISYRSNTSGAREDFSETYVFPNPVKPGYDGPITITGLMNGVNIKITDISGNLVYETVSEGGQAIWYGKTLDGRKVSSGVYLVFITNEDGSKTHIEKILLIR